MSPGKWRMAPQSSLGLSGTDAGLTLVAATVQLSQPSFSAMDVTRVEQAWKGQQAGGGRL
jgi:hypothetical protein